MFFQSFFFGGILTEKIILMAMINSATKETAETTAQKVKSNKSVIEIMVN